MNFLDEIFSINVKVDNPILVGQDDIVGRRQGFQTALFLNFIQ